MTSETQTLTFTRTIQASAGELSRCFTNAMAIREWLCNVAEIEPHAGGRFYVWWPSGYYACGEYTGLVENESVTFSWAGRNEPGPTVVHVTFEEEDGKTILTLQHAGVGVDETWAETIRQFQYGWEFALDNLQHTLETGHDLRILQQPFLGVADGVPLDEKTLSEQGLPVTAGLQLNKLLSGVSLHNAGLLKGDILVKIGHTDIAGWPSLNNAVKKYAVGEKIEVVYYRDGERYMTMAELSQRPAPEVPESREALVKTTRQVYGQAYEQICALLEKVTEEEATQVSKPGIWSINETLAHLLLSERDSHNWFASIVAGYELNTFTSNDQARISAAVQVYGTKAMLLQELKRSFDETSAYLAALPDEFIAHKKSYTRMSTGLLLTAQYHIGQHIEQIQVMLETLQT